MARTRKSANPPQSPRSRHGAIDLAALHARARDLDAKQRQKVKIITQVDPRLYEALIEAAETHKVRMRDLIPRVIAAGLDHWEQFVSPYDANSIAQARVYRPNAGYNRGESAYEKIVGQQAQTLEAELQAEADPLVAAALSLGQRSGHRALPATPKKAAIPSSIDDDEEQQPTPPPEEPA